MSGLVGGQAVTLIDYLTRETGCEYVSELHYLDPARKAKAVEALMKLTAETYPLEKWNDALSYVAELPAQETAEAARAQMIAFYSGDRG